MQDVPNRFVEALGCNAEQVEAGDCSGFVALPARGISPGPIPWLWYAPSFQGVDPRPENVWMFDRLIKRGMAIAGVDVGESYGSPAGRRAFSSFHEKLCTEFGLSERTCLFAQSRGGLMHYNWASENPHRVACIAGIFPVCDLRSYPGLDEACAAFSMDETALAENLADHNPIDRLAPLAAAGVPIMHLHGDDDDIVPLDRNSAVMADRYRELGGSLELYVIPGGQHCCDPAFFQCTRIIEFIAKHV